MDDRASRLLRELVTDHYHGLLSKQSYRERRGKLLDALSVSDEAPVAAAADDRTDKTVQAAAAGSPEPSRPVARTASPTIPPVAPMPAAPAADAAPARRLPLGLAAAAALVLAGAGGAALFVIGGGGGEEPPVSAAVEPAPGAGPAPDGESIFAPFAANQRWTAPELAELRGRWQRLSEAERQESRSTAEYQRFTGLLTQRLREEEALSVGATTPELLRLLELAEALGLPAATAIRARVGVSPDAAPAGAAAANSPQSDAESGAQPGAAAGAQSAASSTEPVAASAVDAPPAPGGSPADPAPAANAGATVAGDAVVAGGAAAPAAAPGNATTPAGSTAASDEASAADACPVSLAPARRLCRDPLRSGAEGPALVVLPAGTFAMGSDDKRNESPVRTVTIEDPFALGVHEVSVAEYRAFCAATGRACPTFAWGADDMPAHNVSWNDAVAYTEWLTAETGFTYFLPSEAQWEYAARAGTTTSYFFGESITPSAARTSSNRRVDSPLGRDDDTINANAFRLMHMAGNLREWVADSWHENYEGAPAGGSAWTGGGAERVVRGGSFADLRDALRSAARAPLGADATDEFTGFRVARVVSP